MAAKKSPGGGENFEHSLKRLTDIVEALEHGDVPLDEVMKLYEEGVMLSQVCLKKLSEAELRLKRLGKDVEGSFELFDGIEE
jgi:exodeoxyribonuclease VII small subunit